MARKRGGVAGFYDRNKGWLKKAVPAGLSFIPGVGIPLAAAAGAAFGADKEGRSFFNLSNIPGALRGAVEGYGIGKGTQAVAGGVKGLLAPKMAAKAGAKGLEAGTSALEGLNVPDLNLPNVPTGLRARGVFEGMGGGDLAPVNMASRVGLTPGVGPITSTDLIGRSVNQYLASGGPTTAPNITTASRLLSPTSPPPSSTVPPPSSGGAGGSGGGAGGSGGSGQMKFRQAMYQPQVLAGIAQGALGMLPDARSAAMDAQTRLAQQQFDEDRRRFQMEEERKRRIAELLMPYMQQNFPQYLGGR